MDVPSFAFHTLDACAKPPQWPGFAAQIRTADCSVVCQRMIDEGGPVGGPPSPAPRRIQQRRRNFVKAPRELRKTGLTVTTSSAVDGPFCPPCSLFDTHP